MTETEARLDYLLRVTHKKAGIESGSQFIGSKYTDHSGLLNAVLQKPCYLMLKFGGSHCPNELTQEAFPFGYL